MYSSFSVPQFSDKSALLAASDKALWNNSTQMGNRKS